MAMHHPHQDYLVEEMRVLARRRYGPRQPGRPPVEHRLVNVERLAILHAIAHNPYHELVFGGMTPLELMRVCAHHLMESLNYREAGKLMRDIERIEREQAQAAPEPPDSEPEPKPAPTPPDDPADTFILDPEAMPVEPPPLTPEEAYLRSLSDRELARQYQAAQRRESKPAPSNDWDPPP